MPATKRPDPIYQRGKYRLYPRAGRNLEIVWYDEAGKRERCLSSGTTDPAEGRLALDRKYLADEGHGLCPTCYRPWEQESPLLSRAIVDYLLSKEGTAGYASSSTRLTQAILYIAETNSAVRCAQVDAAWITKFRDWLALRPVFDRQGRQKGTYSIGHQEGCVRALASAINASPGQKAAFTALQPKDVSKSPAFRGDVALLARMFNYCLRPDGRTPALIEMTRVRRKNLLRYLRLAVATWARPDAIVEAKRAGQWYPEARVFDLNPPNRRQTKKHRPKVAVARQFAPFLDNDDAYLTASTIYAAWEDMRKALGMPEGGEAGPKLIRRSMSTLARKRIGEANWVQGQMMLGHVKFSVSDIYALPDPANLGLALAATESIIDEIDQLAPGAFYFRFTATGAAVRLVEGGKSA